MAGLLLQLFLASTVITCEGKSALLIIDVQDCFLDMNTTTGSAGSLPVTGASLIIPKINMIRAQKSCLYDVVVRSQDFHPTGHISWGSSHGLAPFTHLNGKGGLPLKCVLPASAASTDASCCPAWKLDSASQDCSTVLCPGPNSNGTNADGTPYVYAASNPAISGNAACTTCVNNNANCFDDTQAMWTDHCAQNGDSTFPPSLTTMDTDVLVKKGQNVYVDAYSAFYDNSKHLKTSLDDNLHMENIDHLYVVGIATDVCVKETVMDALSNLTHAYTITVISDASAGLNQAGHDSALVAMEAAGATLRTTAEILAMACPATSTPKTAAASDAVRLNVPFLYTIGLSVTIAFAA